jgi:hypothetical protein
VPTKATAPMHANSSCARRRVGEAGNRSDISCSIDMTLSFAESGQRKMKLIAPIIRQFSNYLPAGANTV